MKNRFEIAEAVAKKIAELENWKATRGYSKKFRIDAVYDELSIFDWWNDYLSLTQLKEMQKFLKTAEELGYNGYVCFKVGAKYCAHGMWAYKQESVNGHSPNGEALYHSFRSGDNYWDCKLPSGKWMNQKYGRGWFTLNEIKAELA